ncbi:MAG TPA: 16S rRNA (guanine(527)-N(7))-methyltransferase RsmG [Nakamurella sp.]
MGPAGSSDDAGSSDVESEPAAAGAVFGDRIETARAYVRMLADDGVVRGLIGPRETDRLWTRHVLNCATLTGLLPCDGRVVDVGSGAGLPGVVLAIARPDCQVVLLEPLERRVRFLVEAVDRLELPNCRVVRGRAQEAPPDVRGADVVVSRAVAPLGRLAAWCAGLARPGGIFLALKGSSAGEELRRDEAEVIAAGLRDPSVVRLDGPTGTTFVVRATRGPDRPRRSRRPNKGRSGRGPKA